MSQAVICQPFTAEARFLSQVSSYDVCGGHSGTGQLFLRVFPFSFHHSPLLLYLQVTVSKIGEHWVSKYLWRPIVKGSSYWYCLLLIEVCSNMKGNRDEDWRLWNCLTSSACAVRWRWYSTSAAQSRQMELWSVKLCCLRGDSAVCTADVQYYRMFSTFNRYNILQIVFFI